MKSFKSFVTTKSFADLVYEEYAQKRELIKQPTVYHTKVYGPTKGEKTKPNYLSRDLNFTPKDKVLNSTSIHDTRYADIEDIIDKLSKLSKYNSQLKMLRNLPKFIDDKLLSASFKNNF